jgi:phage-related protein
MPPARVIFFQDESGHVPVLEWLREIQETNAKAWANCRAKIVLLSQLGHELRRPTADFLRDGIYELRAKQGHLQYRMVYFFHGRHVAVLAHSLTKEDSIPSVEMERALKRKRQFELNPEMHTYGED